MPNVVTKGLCFKYLKIEDPSLASRDISSVGCDRLPARTRFSMNAMMLQTDEKTVQEILSENGRRTGRENLKKRGKEYFSEIGKISASKRDKKYYSNLGKKSAQARKRKKSPVVAFTKLLTTGKI